MSVAITRRVACAPNLDPIELTIKMYTVGYAKISKIDALTINWSVAITSKLMCFGAKRQQGLVRYSLKCHLRYKCQFR